MAYDVLSDEKKRIITSEGLENGGEHWFSAMEAGANELVDMKGTTLSSQEPSLGIRASFTISKKTLCGRSVLRGLVGTVGE